MSFAGRARTVFRELRTELTSARQSKDHRRAKEPTD